MTIGLKYLLLPPCRDSNTVYLPLPCNLAMPPLVKIAGGESSRTPVTLPCSFLKPLQVAHLTLEKLLGRKKKSGICSNGCERHKRTHDQDKSTTTLDDGCLTPIKGFQHHAHAESNPGSHARPTEATALRPSSSKIESPPRDQKYVRAGFLPTACDDHALRRKATLLSTNAGGEGLQGVMSERCRRHQRPLIQWQQRERVHKKKVHGCVRTPSGPDEKELHSDFSRSCQRSDRCRTSARITSQIQPNLRSSPPPRPHEQQTPRTCFVGPAMCAPSLSLEAAAGLLVFSASADDDVSCLQSGNSGVMYTRGLSPLSFEQQWLLPSLAGKVVVGNVGVVVLCSRACGAWFRRGKKNNPWFPERTKKVRVCKCNVDFQEGRGRGAVGFVFRPAMPHVTPVLRRCGGIDVCIAHRVRCGAAPVHVPQRPADLQERAVLRSYS